MADQYWRKPKMLRVNHGEGWWYALERGAIEIHVADGPTAFTAFIRASDLRNFLNMLDHHNPRKRNG